jgi:hypothetical protein
VLDQIGVSLHHHHLATALCRQRGQSAHVIEVCLRRQQDLDIRQLEPGLLDCRFDDGGGLWEAAVDQHVSGRGRNQVHPQLDRPDVVDVADDAERLVRAVPVVLLSRRLLFSADGRPQSPVRAASENLGNT